jgi:hypothetical protein
MTWTIETLKEHLERLLQEHSERYQERHDTMMRGVKDALASADKAVLKAEEAANKRFESVNEFRQTLSDQQRMFFPRQEAEAQLAALEERLTKLERSHTGEAGQQMGVKSGYMWAIGVVAVVSTIIGIFLAVFVEGGAP